MRELVENRRLSEKGYERVTLEDKRTLLMGNLLSINPLASLPAPSLPSLYVRPRRRAALCSPLPNQFKNPSRRCSVKPPLRIKSVGTKVSEEEFAALEARARARKLTLSEWGSGGVAGARGPTMVSVLSWPGVQVADPA